MKKVFSIILAIMMIASVMPMSLAANECVHVYNTETLVRPTAKSEGYYICSDCGENVAVKRADYTEFDKAYAKLLALDYHVYANEESEDKMFNLAMETYSEMYDILDVVDLYIFEATEYEQDVVDSLTVICNEHLSEIDEDVEILFDSTKLANEIIATYHYGIEDFDFVSEKAMNDCRTYGLQFTEIRLRNISVSQSEYDAVVEKLIDFLRKAILCVKGEHIYENAIDNGDGTHTADCDFCIATDIIDEHYWDEYTENGDNTKTAKCNYCDATDTIDNEVTDEEAEDFNSLNFAEKLIALFNDLFNLLSSMLKSIFA